MDYIPQGELVQMVKMLGYWGLFAAVFAETGIFFMFFLPGSSMLFTAGLLASHGLFDVWVLLSLITLAAILGDSTGYLLGSKIGEALYAKGDSRFFKREYVERTREFYERHGVRAVVLARFVPIIRTFAPLLAGVAGMRYSKFFSYNVMGGILWGTGVTFAGYYLGENVPFVNEYITPIILLIIAVTFIPLLTEWKRPRKNKSSRLARCPKAVIFDLDDTLTEHLDPPSPQIMEKLSKLLERLPVAIMSAASFERMKERLLPSLPSSANLRNLYLFPDTAGVCFTHGDSWTCAYAHAFTGEEIARIRAAVEEGFSRTGITEGERIDGERVFAHNAQITVASIGVNAPRERKRAWDPDQTKRRKMKAFLKSRLPTFDVSIGGRTSIDVMHRGVDKSLGVRWLAKKLACAEKDMLFVGDAFYPGGNDESVKKTGVQVIEVKGPRETAVIMDDVLRVCRV